MEAIQLTTLRLFGEGAESSIDDGKPVKTPRPLDVGEWEAALRKANEDLADCAATRIAVRDWFISLPLGVQVAFESCRAAVGAAFEIGDKARALEILQTYPLSSDMEPLRKTALDILNHA